MDALWRYFFSLFFISLELGWFSFSNISVGVYVQTTKFSVAPNLFFTAFEFPEILKMVLSVSFSACKYSTFQIFLFLWLSHFSAGHSTTIFLCQWQKRGFVQIFCSICQSHEKDFLSPWLVFVQVARNSSFLPNETWFICI